MRGRNGSDKRGEEDYFNPKLTTRENACVRLARNNYTNNEISQKLEISNSATSSALRDARRKGAEFTPGKGHKKEHPNTRKYNYKRKVSAKVGIMRFERNSKIHKMVDEGISPSAIYMEIKQLFPDTTEGQVSGVIFRYNQRKKGIDPYASRRPQPHNPGSSES